MHSLTLYYLCKFLVFEHEKRLMQFHVLVMVFYWGESMIGWYHKECHIIIFLQHLDFKNGLYFCGTIFYFIHSQANPSLGGTIKNHLKKWLRNQKWPNHFPQPFLLNIFTTINFFSHVYPLHTLIYGLKFISELKNGNY